MTALALGCGGSPQRAPDAALAGAADSAAETSTSLDGAAPRDEGPGATEDPSTGELRFRVYSARATRIELWVYAEPTGGVEVLRRPLERDAAGDLWRARVTRAELAAAGLAGVVYYGYRAWGPNWPYAPEWTPGSSAGFLADVDGEGNRFDPNKLLFDPYARELSHDPVTLAQPSGAAFRTGASRALDSAPVAPRSVLLPLGALDGDTGPRPTRPFRDEVVYEVHLRGLTMADPTAPAGCAGTYAAAAARAPYLASLGVTAVEFLPVQETQNDANDAAQSTRGMNYWGYSTLAYFAPDRRYACDRTPGGPTREFRAMARAFHEAGLKVYVDVVFNHTAEGGAGGAGGGDTVLYSLRGLDAASYYELATDARGYQNDNGVGANLSATSPAARRLVLDSLRYWTDALGVDGFRFDLAPILGNGCERGCFRYDRDARDNVLNAAAAQLPARPADGGPGVDLVAEPWGVGAGTYQLGNFPAPWAEWNGQFRDLVRQAQNQLGVASVTPGWLADRIVGSYGLFHPRGRHPWNSVNFLVAHDGFTLFDLYHCNGPNNTQPWPYGPSDGGSTTNYSWDQGGDVARQRQAARTGLALLLLSAGVPMLTGGDEMLRSVHCNNNPYNLDSPRNWLDWAQLDAQAAFATFTRRMLRFRASHRALRPADFWSAADHNGDGLAEVSWYAPSGARSEGAGMDDPNNRFLAYRLDGVELGDTARSLYIAYNRDTAPVDVVLPAPHPGAAWHLVADTAAWFENASNAVDPGNETRLNDGRYHLDARAVVLLLER